MKKLITTCLLLTIAFTSQAQDGKPTKEETMQYLKTTVLGVWGGLYGEGIKGKYGTLYALYDMKLVDGCKLYIRTKKQEIDNNVRQSEEIGDWNSIYEFNFSSVEKFEFDKEELMFVDDKRANSLILYYDTKEYRGYKVDGFYCRPENTEKVLKALNHLRKLCGAPEPISFD